MIVEINLKSLTYFLTTIAAIVGMSFVVMTIFKETKLFGKPVPAYCYQNIFGLQDIPSKDQLPQMRHLYGMLCNQAPTEKGGQIYCTALQCQILKGENQ